MTATALASDFLDFDFGGRRVADPATSATLLRLQGAMQSHARASASDLISATRSMLRGVAEECAAPDWDGAGANAVSMTTVQNVERLIGDLHAFLPSSVPLPDIVPENDGDLSLTWQAASDQLFSISVAASGAVAFASRLAGGVEFHGKARLGNMSDDILRSLGTTISGLFTAGKPRR